jgi:prevent-host-death family protein
MDISVSDAKALLSDLVRRAEHGEDVVLTRHGRAVARLIPIVERPSSTERRAVLDAVRAEGRANATRGSSAADSQDFLYDSSGLPE